MFRRLGWSVLYSLVVLLLSCLFFLKKEFKSLRGFTVRQFFWVFAGFRRSQCFFNYIVVNVFLFLFSRYRFFLIYRYCRNFFVLLEFLGCVKDIFLFLVIKSQFGYVERRAVIRSIWGRAGDWVRGQQLKLVFFLGVVGFVFLVQLLVYESREFDDILQWDFVEDFFNLIFKELYLQRWVAVVCFQVYFMLKGDDDVFVYVFNVFEFLDGWDLV